MNNSGQIILYLFLFIASMATGYWFYNNFAWVEKEQEVGFQGIAKANKLLAAEFFLRKMGVPVRQVNGLIAFRDLPSPQHTLLIATQRETLNKQLSQELLTWVRAGGHLIVEARYLSNESGHKDKKKDKHNKNKKNSSFNDHLLAELSVFTTKSNAGEENNDIPVIVPLVNERQSSLKGKQVQVNFPYQRILSRSTKVPEPVWLVKDELGKYVMQFSMGQGLLTVLASTSMFTNDQIGGYEHARFLYYLIQQQGHNGGVWLIRADDMPALWQWLWDNAWYAMFCLTMLFLLWLWRAPLRFGPQLKDVQTQRRSLLEHLQASGYYRWYENQSGFLLARVQEALWEKIQASHPDIRRENLLQAYVMLEEITGIEQALIKQALGVEKSINEHEFTNKIRLLESIRKRL
ncbi:MAG: DUF4350 domain-containing protein [Gammaproteobacteria bacterium]|nr:DUF4350 domain-containing protein [Gammaproteobacteria bacterium]